MDARTQSFVALALVFLALGWFVYRALRRKAGRPCGGCSCPKPKL